MTAVTLDIGRTQAREPLRPEPAKLPLIGLTRNQLAEALALCRRQRAILVIARLDRLARNVNFISGLMDSRVDFVAVDMPEANRLTIHILAAVAEHEREMISKRTKAALQVAKTREARSGSSVVRW